MMRRSSEEVNVFEEGEGEGDEAGGLVWVEEGDGEGENVGEADGVADVVADGVAVGEGNGEGEGIWDADGEGELKVAVTVPLTSLWVIGSEVSSGGTG